LHDDRLRGSSLGVVRGTASPHLMAGSSLLPTARCRSRVATMPALMLLDHRAGATGSSVRWRARSCSSETDGLKLLQRVFPSRWVAVGEGSSVGTRGVARTAKRDGKKHMDAFRADAAPRTATPCKRDDARQSSSERSTPTSSLDSNSNLRALLSERRRQCWR